MKQGTRHGAASRRRERNERAHVWPSTNGRSLQRPPVCGVARWLLCLRFDGVRVRGAALLDAARLVPDTTHTARRACHVLQWPPETPRHVSASVWRVGGVAFRWWPVCGAWRFAWRAPCVWHVWPVCGRMACVWRVPCFLYVWRVCIRWTACTCATRRGKICCLDTSRQFENTCNVRGVPLAFNSLAY